MTMAVITALVIARERERGTMENLLATSIRPTEVLIARILPITHFLRVVRAILLKGNTFTDVWSQLCRWRSLLREYSPSASSVIGTLD